jgi:hypothetical protein
LFLKRPRALGKQYPSENGTTTARADLTMSVDWGKENLAEPRIQFRNWHETDQPRWSLDVRLSM